MDQLIPAAATEQALTVSNDPFETLLNPERFDLLARASQAFSKSTIVPKHFQGKPNDIFVVLQMAISLRIDPMTMLQSTYVISGRPGMSASLVVALAGRSGIFAGPITYQTAGKGDTLEATATATIKETGEQVSETVSMVIAKAEEWTRNKKYATMPAHMLKYRAATWLVRRYAPQVLLGLQTADELRDVAASKAKPATRASATTSGPNQDSLAYRRQKHINQKIGEMGLDRDLVKAGMKREFGIDSTGRCDELSDEQWARLLGDTAGIASAAFKKDDAGKEGKESV